MRLILFILKCFVGILATIGLVLVLLVAGGIFLWSEVEEVAVKEEIEPQSVVLLDLSKPIIETLPANAFARASARNAYVLPNLLEEIEAAAADPRITGLVARLGPAGLGMATIQEIRDAIAAFRSTGKFAYVFTESFGPSSGPAQQYYLASAFEQIWLQPSGDLALAGIALESPFLREGLDELGIVPRLDQREEYKGAVEFLNRQEFSEPVRRNLQRLVDSWLEQIVAGIAEGRGLDPQTTRDLIDSGPYLATDALDLGLVDKLAYWDELLSELWNGSDADLLLEIADYSGRREKPEVEGPVVALIQGIGPVTQTSGDGFFDEASLAADRVSKALREAIDDEAVTAILFRVDSPGGSYVAADQIWREVKRAGELGKPVIFSMGNIAASGGYFVAAPAEKILASPGSLTGSIGVAGGKLVMSGLWDRLGISWDAVEAGENARMWSANQDFTEAQWQHFQSSLDRIYDDFVTKVAEGRAMEREAVLNVAGGRVWTGADAVENGLIDELGGFKRALEAVRESVGLASDAPIDLQIYPKPESVWQTLLHGALDEELDIGTAITALGDLVRLSRALAPLIEIMETEPRGAELRAAPLRRTN